MSNEPGVEYTEVVHPRSADLTRGNASHGTQQNKMLFLKGHSSGLSLGLPVKPAHLSHFSLRHPHSLKPIRQASASWEGPNYT